MKRRAAARNRSILLPVVSGLGAGAVKRRTEFRDRFVRDAWTLAKRFAAGRVVQNIDRSELAGLGYYRVVEGPIDDPHRLLLAALAQALQAKTFFEIGTNRGWTTWTVAHNNPELDVVTLDVPPGADAASLGLSLGDDDRRFLTPGDESGEAFRGTPEAARITHLRGDSATFDFTPYHGAVDLVYIDGAHEYDYVRNDSAAALKMLAPGGTIAWDDYTTNPDVWRAVRDVARELPAPVYHLYGTRMALYTTRDDLVARRQFDRHSVPAL